MARCTSPEPRGAPSNAWTAVAGIIMAAAMAGLLRLPGWRGLRRQLARIAATLYLAGLATVSLTAWHVPAGGLREAAPALGGLHLMLLLSLGSVIAVTSLLSAEEAQACAATDAGRCGDGLGELMAHMSHALRTPLNAVIGFSEVMARELHGPLGNSRYQEYAHHICESGGRLLKSSEDALAVTQAMTSLMTDRGRSRRERVAVDGLLRQAWAVIEAVPPVSAADCAALTIICERRTTAQALAHLLRHALMLAGPNAIEIVAWPDRAYGFDIRVLGSGGKRLDPDAGDLHLILARLLLQTQDATLTCAGGEEGWSASVGFARSS